MITLASGFSYFDLRFRGLPRIIATVVLQGPDGVALIDPGPSSTLPTLRVELEQAGMSLADVRIVLLTHIHLDHAGGVGTLAQQIAGLRVYVHEKGAPHLVDPSKLVASATRLFGDDMDRLWGECRPVPADRLIVLRGEERIDAGGRTLDVAYTPGHASHHVSFFSADCGMAFVGDAAGVRLHADGVVLPPTPPPDIDLEAWRLSLARIGRWRPESLFVTHFGPYAAAEAHLAEMADRLERAGALARASLEGEGTDEDRERWFVDELRRDLRNRMTEDDARAYEVAGRFDLNWRGLARYWRKTRGSHLLAPPGTECLGIQ